MPIVINGSGTITGLAEGGIEDAKILPADLKASSGSAGNTTYYRGDGAWGAPSGGIEGYDMWRLTSNLTGNQLPITTGDLERVDDTSSVKIGTGMSVSSGVFSFPDTGIWRVTWSASVESDVDTHQNVFTIEVTSDNGSNWDTTARTRQGIYKMSTGTSYGHGSTTCIVDVTSTTNVKVRFEYIAGQGSERLMGSTNDSLTSFEFIRLGDT